MRVCWSFSPRFCLSFKQVTLWSQTSSLRLVSSLQIFYCDTGFCCLQMWFFVVNRSPWLFHGLPITLCCWHYIHCQHNHPPYIHHFISQSQIFHEWSFLHPSFLWASCYMLSWPTLLVPTIVHPPDPWLCLHVELQHHLHPRGHPCQIIFSVWLTHAWQLLVP